MTTAVCTVPEYNVPACRTRAILEASDESARDIVNRERNRAGARKLVVDRGPFGEGIWRAATEASDVLPIGTQTLYASIIARLFLNLEQLQPGKRHVVAGHPRELNDNARVIPAKAS